MQTIHSSSLTHNQPVAYSKPQQSTTAAVDSAQKNSEQNTNTETKALPATIEQIESTLNQAGWTTAQKSDQPSSKAEKAVQFYNQTYRQAMQLNISETIAGIDLYA